jgi:hypothetical protein
MEITEITDTMMMIDIRMTHTNRIMDITTIKNG